MSLNVINVFRKLLISNTFSKKLKDMFHFYNISDIINYQILFGELTLHKQ